MKRCPSTIVCLGTALMVLTSLGCGEDTSAPAVNACGECPAGYFCTADDLGHFCQEAGEPGLIGGDVVGSGPPPSDSNASSPSRGEDVSDGQPANEGGSSTSPQSPAGDTNPSSDSSDSSIDNGDGSSNSGACEEIRLQLKPSPGSIPRVMLVVDRSYSMIVEEDRWTPIEQTLSRVTESLSGTVDFGLVLFPSPDPDIFGNEAEIACSPGEVNVAPGAETASDIRGWLMNEPPQPGLATPTYSALEAAGNSLLANPSGNDYILLATDGGPGCNFGLDADFCTCLNHSCPLGLPEMCLDDQRTVSKVGALADAGVKTMVLGIASDAFMPESRAVLDRMAVAGRTDQGGRHYEVNRVADLEQRLTAAAGQLAPCTYDLGELATHADALIITIDNQTIDRDLNHTNGWDVNGNTVEFYGAACQMLRDGNAHEIRADCR